MIRRHHSAVLTLLLLGVFPSASPATDAPQVLATSIFERGEGEYAAFPNLYRDIHGRIVLRFTARQQASHVNSRGTLHIYTSDDCGLSWQRAESALPPAVQYTGTPGQYRQISSGGWRKAVSDEAIPAGAIVRRDEGDRFFAHGLFLMGSQDDGRSWSRQPVATPEHGVLMNHHIGSQLLTSSGTYLAALYIKTHEKATDQVLMVRQRGEQPPSTVLIPGLGGSRPVGGNETALSQAPDGRIVAFIRPDPDKLNRLLIAISEDDGLNWSTPHQSDLVGYPPHAVRAGEDILLTTADRRNVPLSIQVYRLDPRTLKVKSRQTLAQEFTLRPSDFGYPITLPCHTGGLTAYYRPHTDGGAEVVAISWQ